MAKFEKPKMVLIEEIPTKWGEFPLNDNDEWVKVSLPDTDEVASCLYRVNEDSTFLPHKHEVDEVLTVINRGGEVKLITTEGSIKLKYGETYKIPSNVTHACEIKKHTKLLCVWLDKKDDGWGAVINPDVNILN